MLPSACADLVGPVAVALSGGLDSAMALVLLHEAGYQVTGVTMRLLPDAAEDGQETADVASARAICARYGIDHHLVDLSDAFSRQVIASFVAEYGAAHTPNPCILCNQVIKFGALLEYVQALGMPYMATGHYVRSGRASGQFRLLRGVDAGKDQSYFLYTLSQEQLAHLCFPLGGYLKKEVRALARERDLSVTERPESQDVCFLRGEAYAALVGRLAPGSIRPGPILTRSGVQLGMHKGLPLYTVGQRSGLGIAAPRPVYVLELDAARNALVVGHSDELLATALVADGMRYVSGVAPAGQVQVQAQIRYRARPAAATLFPLEGERALVRFDSPVRAVAPGQAVVLYHGDEVIGGGRIVHAQQQSHTEEQ